MRPVPHGAFTQHWIRKVPTPPATPVARAADAPPIEAYFARDRTGPEAPPYEGLGEVDYASLAGDGRVLDKAAAALDSALAHDTSHAQALFLLGVAYEQRGQPDRAIAALERSVRIDSSRPDPLRALAQRVPSRRTTASCNRGDRPPRPHDATGARLDPQRIRILPGK